MFVDFMTGILVAAFLLFEVIIDLKVNLLDVTTKTEKFLDIMSAQFLRIFLTLFFFGRFLGLVCWYRCS